MKISSFFCLIAILVVACPVQASKKSELANQQEATSWFSGAPAPVKQLFYAMYKEARKSPFFATISPLGFLGMFYMWWKNQGLLKDAEKIDLEEKVAVKLQGLQEEKLGVESTQKVNGELDKLNKELEKDLKILQERLNAQSFQFTEWIQDKQKESEENLYAKAILEEMQRLEKELKVNNLSQEDQNIKNGDLSNLMQLHRLAILRPTVEGDSILSQQQNGNTDIFSNFSTILSTSVPITARFGLVTGSEGRSEIDPRIGEFWQSDFVGESDLAIYPVKLNEGEGANQPKNDPLGAPYARAMYTKRSFLENKEDNFICKIISVCYTDKLDQESYHKFRNGIEEYIFAEYLRNPNDKIIFQVLFEDLNNFNQEGIANVLADATKRFSQVSVDLLYCTDSGACAKLSEFSGLFTDINTLILCAPEATKAFENTVSELNVQNVIGAYSTGYRQVMTHRKTDELSSNNIWVRITQENGSGSNELSLEQLKLKVPSLLPYLVNKVLKKNIFTDFELYIRSSDRDILPLFTLRSHALNKALLEESKNFEKFGTQFEYYSLKKAFSDVIFSGLHEKSSEKMMNNVKDVSTQVIGTTAKVGGTIFGYGKNTVDYFYNMYLKPMPPITN